MSEPSQRHGRSVAEVPFDLASAPYEKVVTMLLVLRQAIMGRYGRYT
jgi:hypothetical protein